MKATDLSCRTNAQILEEASTWFIEIGEGALDARARAAFNDWLRRSPEHVRAYLETAAIWENTAFIDKHKRYDAEALLAMTAGSANIVHVGEPRGRPAPQRSEARKMRRRVLAASVAILFSGACVLAWLELGRVPAYSTGIGAHQSVALADGSTVTLNASSRIRVRFDSGRRDIELVRGQALFSVAKDPARPFVVHSGTIAVTAVGTQFDVDRRKRRTIVTVLEGRVAVVPGARGASADTPGAHRPTDILLNAGEQVAVTALAEPLPARADLAAATAWTRRRLVFSSTPLDEVVEEYNRYHGRRLTIRDPQLEGFNISGTFSSTDADSLIDFLRAQPGIAVHQTSSAIEIAAR